MPLSAPYEPCQTPLKGVWGKSLAVFGRSRSITLMGNETAAVKRPTGERRAVATSGQIVGEYIGQRAGDAAQAVRRAGLCPGLERTFGCDPSLLGLVVSQEPAAGSALSRNGMVTLHVAAPGTPSKTANTTPEPGPAPPSAPGPRTESEPASACVDVDAGDRELREAAGTARRRRKPSLSRRGPVFLDVPPTPIPPAASEPLATEGEQEWGEMVEPEPTYEVDGAGRFEEVSSEDGFDGFTADEFVVHVDEVFAGPIGRWRPVRRARFWGTGRDLCEWLRGHPWLTGSAALAIGVWVLLGISGGLMGQHPVAPTKGSGSPPAVREPIARTKRRPRTPIVRAPRRGRPTRHQRAQSTRRAQTGTRSARSHVPALTPVPARELPAATAPSVPVRVSEPPSPPARVEQTSGGLFSP